MLDRSALNDCVSMTDGFSCSIVLFIPWTFKMTPERTFGVTRQPLLFSILPSFPTPICPHQLPKGVKRKRLPSFTSAMIPFAFFGALPSGLKGDHVWLGSSIYAIEVKWRAWPDRVVFFISSKLSQITSRRQKRPKHPQGWFIHNKRAIKLQQQQVVWR